MISSSVLFLVVLCLLCSEGYPNSVKGPVVVGLNRGGSGGGQEGIHAKTRLEERRNFFHIFNVPYIVCFFAAKGKWPFVPSFMQVQVDQVGRSIFPQSDGFIRNYCRKWMQIKECFRPHNIIPVSPDPLPMTAAPIPAINTEVETFMADPPTTPCSCAQRFREVTSPPAPVVYFDKNYIGNVSSDTIMNTIEFLESFLPPTTKKPKRRNKIRDRT